MAQKDNLKEPQPFSIERMMASFKEKCLSIPSKKAKTIIIGGTLLSIGIIAAVTLLDFIPQWLFPFLTWPIGIFLFCVGSYCVYKYEEKHPDTLTLKERWSFRRRIKIFSVLGVVYIALLLFVSPYIPNSLGGVITIAVILGAYNAIRRSPDELRLAELGIIDPRDGDILVEDTEKEQYFVPDDENYETENDELEEEKGR